MEQKQIQEGDVIEVKKQCTFYVKFPDFLEIDSFFIEKTTLPKLKNLKKWDNIKIELCDVSNPSAAKSVNNLIDLCKRKKRKLFKNDLFDFEIRYIDSSGDECDKWIIKVKDIISIDFGSLNYSDDKLNKIIIVLKPSKCIYEIIKKY